MRVLTNSISEGFKIQDSSSWHSKYCIEHPRARWTKYVMSRSKDTNLVEKAQSFRVNNRKASSLDPIFHHEFIYHRSIVWPPIGGKRPRDIDFFIAFSPVPNYS